MFSWMIDCVFKSASWFAYYNNDSSFRRFWTELFYSSSVYWYFSMRFYKAVTFALLSYSWFKFAVFSLITYYFYKSASLFIYYYICNSFLRFCTNYSFKSEACWYFSMFYYCSTTFKLISFSSWRLAIFSLIIDWLFKSASLFAY